MFISNLCMRLDALPVKSSLHTAAEHFERPRVADRVWADEDPVLPGREPSEDARLHRLRGSKSKVGLQAGKRIRREAAALLQRKSDLIGPVQRIGCSGDET